MSTPIKFLTKNFGAYDTSSIGAYMNIGGFSALKKAVNMDPEDICTLLSDAKIKGRGGAEYPLGRKWSQARAVRGENKVVICNADEGETTTFKDRELIKNDPFNLIEAMIIAGFVCGATDGYIYMRAEYACFRPLLLNAIRQAKNYGFLGENILGKGFNFNIHLYSGGGAYVCGEGTALIRSIEGKAGRPRMKPPFIKVSGLFARPTCLNNVESLSLVPHLLMDSDMYMHCGMGESIGTKLISVAGNVNNPGVFEIPFGTTVREIIYELAGGMHGRQQHNQGAANTQRRPVKRRAGPALSGCYDPHIFQFSFLFLRRRMTRAVTAGTASTSRYGRAASRKSPMSVKNAPAAGRKPVCSGSGSAVGSAVGMAVDASVGSGVGSGIGASVSSGIAVSSAAS